MLAAACIASFVSRRSPDWADWAGPALETAVAALVAAELERPEHPHWSFLDALARMVGRVADWAAVDAALETYRAAWRATPIGDPGHGPKAHRPPPPQR